uniref:Major facilitator superfamily (MFS) profile domain-containing protein n=1 Tax=Oryza barthii TaxID=65489 RepID=A0A0D3F6R3_9ORYZ
MALDMSGGGSIANDGEAAAGGGGGGRGEVTFTVVMSCLTAGAGGLLLGYDIGVTGGVTQMESFLQAFFPEVLRKMSSAKQDAYCIFDSQVLNAFVSSFYLSTMVASLVAGHLTKTLGRRNSLLIAGVLFFAGTLLNLAAVNISMLIIGRILLGVAVGFSSLAAPVYLAEIAPARWRGAFTASIGLFGNLGFLMADMINYRATTMARWGWRLSLGAGIVPAVIVIVGAAFIPDTPNSLALRGRLDEARDSLRRIRGAADVDAELKDIVRAAEEDRRYESGALRRFLRREYRPHLVMAVLIMVFFEMTGAIVVAIFTPLLFYTVGFTSQKAILGSIITDVVSIVSVAAAAAVVDRHGRRRLFMVGGAVLILCQVAMAWIFGAQLGADGGRAMPRGYAVAVVALVCTYTAGLSVSWGSLSSVVTSEIFPLEVRSAALGLGGTISSALTFMQSQSFLEMLCSFKYGAFAYYAGWLVMMTAFVAAFLPETKGVPIESMGAVWAQHWYWRRFVQPAPAKQLGMGGGGSIANDGEAAAGGNGGGDEVTFTVVMSCLTAGAGGLLLGYDIGVTGMGGGGSIANDGEAAAGGNGGGDEVTFTVVMSCLTAGAGGLLLGYDIGAFFPEVLRKMSSAKQDAYCIFDSQVLNAFVSSFYLSTMVASLVAGHLTKTLGRRNSLLIAGVLFFAGTLLNLAAVNISMLIIGRILLGVAVGFSSLAAPVYLAEISPARWRGAFTSSIGLFANFGFLMADMINYRATTMARWGWRLSLGAGVVPALIVIVGAASIPDTPNSLALRGRLDEARDSLRRIRGAADVDAELKDIVRAAEEDRRYESGALRRLLRREYRPHLVMAVLIMVFFEMTGAIVVAIFTPLLFYTVGFTSQKAILGSIITDVDIVRAAEEDRRYESGALRRLLRREYRPHLVMAVLITVFYEMTGGVVVGIFTPLLFYTVGFTSQKAILGSIITDVVSISSVAVAAVVVDRRGRRTLFMVGGVVLILCQVAMAWIFGAELGTDGGRAMPRGYAVAVVALVCMYAAGLCVSWVPLSSVVTSEIFPLEVRSAALGLGGAISSALTFMQSQSFLEMLCSFKYGAFAYYAGWLVMMTAFVAAFLPETKGVPIESMGAVWAQHWYWKRFVKLAPAKQADGPE